MECDLKLDGGEVVDGTGAGAVRADVALVGGEIAAVGDLAALEAQMVLDCSGKTITPGFIDVHSHADWLVSSCDHGRLVEPFIRQGMTSFVGGNCGFSPAPITDRSRGMVLESSKLMMDDAIDLRWKTMAEFLDLLERQGTALNIAELVGHGSIRAAVTGELTMDAPDKDELATMEGMTRRSLDAGCIGVSTGLGYPPGIFAEPDELDAFAGWTAEAGKLFTSHLKAYSSVSGAYTSDPTEVPHNLRALDEVLVVAEDAGVKLQLSHLIFVGSRTWPTYVEVLGRIEKARADGLDVAFDAFPYTAGNTTASVLFPAQMLPRLEEILRSPEGMAGLRSFAEIAFDQVGFNLDDIQIMNANTPSFDCYNGLFVGEAARRAGMDIWDFYGQMVVDSHRNARVLIHKYSGESRDERALTAVLEHPLCSIETDTLLSSRGSQNPASYGTFPRVLSTYVERGLFTFEEAVHRMTGAPASRAGWTGRGRVAQGYAADLVVLDRAELRDMATFESPASYPAGIEHVFINGRHVLDGHTYDADAMAGQVFRS